MPTVVELDRADSTGCWFLPKIIELKTFCLDFDNVQKSKILGSFLFFQIICMSHMFREQKSNITVIFRTKLIRPQVS